MALPDGVDFRIAQFSDTHLGYSAKCRIDPATGLNQRVQDGYLALKHTVDQILESDVNLVIQSGDLFHRSWPQVSDIVWARRQLNRLADAGIPVVVIPGNHDAAAERGKTPATDAVHDPDRGITAISGPTGLYRPPGFDGLTVTALTHYGLVLAERLVPEAVDGDVNILVAHGSAVVPGHAVFRCIDSPGEQPIGADILTDPGWQFIALGHYHGMGALPDLPHAWYAGSALRRGFSDVEGGRGWLQIDVHGNGNITVVPRYIKQRAQYDLPVVDAAGMSGEDVADAVLANLASIDTHDAIIRQIITNVTASHRAGLNLPALSRAASDSLMWMPVIRRPETSESPTAATTSTGESLRTARAVDLSASFTAWLPTWPETQVWPEPLTAAVLEDGAQRLQETNPDGNADLSAPVTPTPVKARKADKAEGTAVDDDPFPTTTPVTVAVLPVDDDPFAAWDETATGDSLTDAVTGEEVPW